MPKCTFGSNDKIAQATSNAKPTKHVLINIDQLRFHRCVQLSAFDQERCITFVPRTVNLNWRIIESAPMFNYHSMCILI
eukprot:UN12762